jgi:hypothetical protein
LIERKLILNQRPIIKKVIFILLVVCSCTEDDNTCHNKNEAQIEAQILSIQELPDQTYLHNAFTDIIKYNNSYFICFRSSDKHVYGNNGIIQIYKMNGDEEWTHMQSIELDTADLRDPKFLVSPDNNLHIYIHGSIFNNKELANTLDLRYTFIDGSWKNPQIVKVFDYDSIISPWPWRISWIGDTAVTFAYSSVEFNLYYSIDGLNFEKSSNSLFLDKFPTEATTRSNNEGLFTVVRRNHGDTFMLSSKCINSNWSILDTIEIRNFGGPNFIFFDDQNIILCGRMTIDSSTETLPLLHYNLSKYNWKELLVLPGNKDMGYPGIFKQGDNLHISYYSTDRHNIKTSVFHAIVELKESL